MVLTKHQIETFSVEKTTHHVHAEPNDYFLEISDEKILSLVKIRIKDTETYVKKDDLKIILNNL